MICMFKAILYCQLMCLRTLEICLEIYELDPADHDKTECDIQKQVF